MSTSRRRRADGAQQQHAGIGHRRRTFMIDQLTDEGALGSTPVRPATPPSSSRTCRAARPGPNSWRSSTAASSPTNTSSSARTTITSQCAAPLRSATPSERRHRQRRRRRGRTRRSHAASPRSRRRRAGRWSSRFWDPEEDGLLGSLYYTQHPIVPIANTSVTSTSTSRARTSCPVFAASPSRSARRPARAWARWSAQAAAGSPWTSATELDLRPGAQRLRQLRHVRCRRLLQRFDRALLSLRCRRARSGGLRQAREPDAPRV